MTKKDYELIAGAVKGCVATFSTESDNFERGYQEGTINLAGAIADRLKVDNPRFDRARFLKACGF